MTIDLQNDIALDQVDQAIQEAFKAGQPTEGAPSVNPTDQGDQDSTDLDLDQLHGTIMGYWRKLQTSSGLDRLFPTKGSLLKAGMIDHSGNTVPGNLAYSAFFSRGKLTGDNRRATTKTVDLLVESLDRGLRFSSADRVATYKGFTVIAKAYQAFLATVKDSDLILAANGFMVAKTADLSAANAARRTLATTLQQFAKPLAEEKTSTKLVRSAKGLVRSEQKAAMTELESDPIVSEFNRLKALERARILAAKLEHGSCDCGNSAIARVFTRKSGDLQPVDKLVCQTEIDSLMVYGIPGYSRFSVEVMRDDQVSTNITGYVMANGKVTQA